MSTSTLAVIGGSGLYTLHEGAESESIPFTTPFSENPVILELESTSAGAVWFLARHGKGHTLAPHEINYRANLWALREAGVSKVLAVNAVGGITAGMLPGALVVPDQLIDYTWGREQTLFSGQHSFDKHIDFTNPYTESLRQALLSAAQQCKLKIVSKAVYACTQGPRLETAAEVVRLARDGNDIIGMTAMPEAALARELGLDYACLALVVNKAAGLTEEEISLDEIHQVVKSGITDIRSILLAALQQLQS